MATEKTLQWGSTYVLIPTSLSLGLAEGHVEQKMDAEEKVECFKLLESKATKQGD